MSLRSTLALTIASRSRLLVRSCIRRRRKRLRRSWVSDQAHMAHVLRRVRLLHWLITAWARERAMLAQEQMVRQALAAGTDHARPVAAGILVQAAHALLGDLSLHEEARAQRRRIECSAAGRTLRAEHVGEAAVAEEVT